MRAKLVRLMRLLKGLLVDQETRSPAFRRFWFSFYEERDYPRHKLDVDALAALAGSERELAERMLIEALPDARAVVGLGALGSRHALRRLTDMFEAECAAAQHARIAGNDDWSGAGMIATAQALWRIEPCARLARALIGRLRCAAAWTERMDAAAALAAMPGEEVEAALFEALDDRDALVRHHAARSLLTIHGVAIDARAAHHMIYCVMGAERRAGNFVNALREANAEIDARPQF